MQALLGCGFLKKLDLGINLTIFFFWLVFFFLSQIYIIILSPLFVWILYRIESVDSAHGLTPSGSQSHNCWIHHVCHSCMVGVRELRRLAAPRKASGDTS